MSKLHMYRNIGGHISKFADGDGDVSQEKAFDVSITWGSVTKGTVYEIRQGVAPDGDRFDCQAGAGVGGTARFLKAAAGLAHMSEEQLGATLALRAAVLASEKSVEIRIGEDDLRTLKAANYKLCFAKKVGEAAYNVVWQSYTKYLVNNQFSWTPQYQLFGTNTFQENVRVRVATNQVTIGLGEQCTLDSAGVLGPAATGGPATAITMIDNYGSIHPGVNQLSTGLDGRTVSTPIYVAPAAMVMGPVSLTPVEKVLVWFEQDIETSTMFSNARSNAVEIDLTSTNSAVRLYSNQAWSTPTQSRNRV